MKRKWEKLAGDLLQLASEQFSNHGCNDWKWPTDWTDKERLEFARAMVADNRARVKEPPGAEDEEEARDMAQGKYGPPDWWVMLFLANELRKSRE